MWYINKTAIPKAICLLHTGQSCDIRQLPQGTSVMSALILSCTKCLCFFFFDKFWNTVAAQLWLSQYPSKTPPRSVMSHCSASTICLSGGGKKTKPRTQWIIYFWTVSFLGLTDSPRSLFAVRGSDHGHLRVQSSNNHCLDQLLIIWENVRRWCLITHCSIEGFSGWKNTLLVNSGGCLAFRRNLWKT